MTGCAAPNCSTSGRTKPTPQFFRFPVDEERRKKWTIQSKRAQWEPKTTDRLCEFHFEADCFEVTKGGKRRLKKNAIPSLFKHRPIPKHRATENSRGIQRIQATFQHAFLEEHNYCSSWEASKEAEEEDKENQDPNKENQNPDLSPVSVSEDCQTSTPSSNKVKNEAPLDEHMFENACTSLPARNDEEIVTTCDESLIKENQRLKQELSKALKAQGVLRKKLRRSNLVINKEKGAAAQKELKRQKRKIYSTQEIRKGLKLRFACGRTGYNTVREELKEQLPCLDTLYRHTRQHKYAPGVLEEVFEMLSVRVSTLNYCEDRVCLVLDEMKIEEGCQYDPNLKQNIGDVTLPGHEGVADHACTWMIGSIGGHWKQEIAYHFTPDSVDGDKFAEVTNDLIHRIEGIGLKVDCVTCDLGGPNQKMLA